MDREAQELSRGSSPEGDASATEKVVMLVHSASGRYFQHLRKLRHI